MLPEDSSRKVRLEITTFSNKSRKTLGEKMSEDKDRKKPKQSRFICSICLNTRPVLGYTVECGRRKTVSCPICQKPDDEPLKELRPKRSPVASRKSVHVKEPEPIHDGITEKGYHLLNEILTSFHNKKMQQQKEKQNEIITHKDVAVGPDEPEKRNSKPKLCISKVFQFSVVEENKECDENFVVITNHADSIMCHPSIDLIRRKSYSIPQMKLDELKNFFKEKTKSKDAIQEVNRMFATVKQSVGFADDDVEHLNRPMVRSGPRVLPVVKTKQLLNQNDRECYTQTLGKEFCDKCVYTLCCPHCNWSRNNETNAVVCDYCCQSQIICQHGEQETFQIF